MEARAHLSLLWDVIEHMKWCEDAEGVTMMGRGLDFRQAEGLIRDSANIHGKKVVPFIVMIRPSSCHRNLVSWTKQALLNMSRSTQMMVEGATKNPHFWEATPVTTIRGLVAAVELSVPITILAQETPQDQLGHATIDRAAVMSIFQPVLDDFTRVTIVKVDLSSVKYETGNVATYKVNDIFSMHVWTSVHGQRLAHIQNTFRRTKMRLV